MKVVTTEDVQEHRKNGKWRHLEALSVRLTNQAEKAANSSMKVVLGGGTRLMLAIEHRLSDDVDLFINDSQWISYLSPRLNDAVEDLVSDYDELATVLKLRFPEGEIDYIVSGQLLDLPSETSPETSYQLEPVAEVLAKKLFYRGYALTPRDLFDWYMIEHRVPPEELHLELIARVLVDKFEGIELSLHNVQKLPSDHIAWKGIRTPYPIDLHDTVDWAMKRISYYKTLL